MTTALSMISTVVASTFARVSGLAFLTKTMPSTEPMLRNGSTYVDLPNFRGHLLLRARVRPHELHCGRILAYP